MDLVHGWTPTEAAKAQEDQFNPDSNYINSLESRLNRLKSPNKEPTSKDLLNSITKAKATAMGNLTVSSNDPYLSEYTSDLDSQIDNSSFAGVLQRKFQPEKQALTTEELAQLLENDELSKISNNLEAQEDNERNTRADTD